ncbi:MAG: TspO/MBR family protein [Candidatus Erginobacter occultus]|nr:TspO/MBR family protein [Candidatus Erginobacter occultus]
MRKTESPIGDYREMNTWYADLNKPPLTPPNWVFSPVWIVLYVMIAVAIFLYYRSPDKRQVALTSALLALHLAANFAWTYLFFGLRSPALALADIVVLDVTLVLLIVRFWRASPPAGALLIPYLLWVLFATYLNIGIFSLN